MSIDVPVLTHYAMKKSGGVRSKLHRFLNSASKDVLISLTVRRLPPPPRERTPPTQLIYRHEEKSGCDAQDRDLYRE